MSSLRDNLVNLNLDVPLDYYSLLDIRRDCSENELKAAYRKYALKFHPSKQSSDLSKQQVEQQFRVIAEAYEVLSDPQKRAIFDQYGEKGLKNGISNGKAGKIGGYVYRGNPYDTFSEHFGSTSPFVDFFNGESGMSSMFATQGRNVKPQKVSAQEINLYVSLEELYIGCSKKVKVSRKRLQADGQTTEIEEKTLSVEIGAGWKEGTKITFPREGDEESGSINGDIIFIVKQKPHPRFTRKGYDLIYVANISLNAALTGCVVDIESLDGRILPISISDIATPTSNKIVPDQGFLNSKTNIRGNLIITFNITFPQQLSQAAKNEIKKLLPQ